MPTRFALVLLVVAFAACRWAEPVPPGALAPSPRAQARLNAQRDLALARAVLHATQYAAAHPQAQSARQRACALIEQLGPNDWARLAGEAEGVRAFGQRCVDAVSGTRDGASSQDGELPPDVSDALAQSRRALGQGDLALGITTLSWVATTPHPQARNAAVAALQSSVGSAPTAKYAAVVSDAAWALRGEPHDPAHATRLVSYAQALRTEQRPDEALWVTRRALVADPGHAQALDLEQDLSINSYSGLGWGVFVTGLAAALVAGSFLTYADSTKTKLQQEGLSDAQRATLASRRDTAQKVALGFGIGGGVGIVLGPLLWYLGAKDYQPTSPSSLPALVP